ncbi:DNA repair protein RadA [Prochlorococcus sp. MIT 1223]|uniref:DNA repair protein RadA n=1 Tax=Prochlorococcus sp. MIT 1223 TaxID=3096217 RepID=UPI002A75950E|nr:DNA repair protein RadA [Prochlorococcus sp. MIT 1223]
MNRSVSIFVCQSCGAETRQFFGRCSNCGEWNSIVEEIRSKSSASSRKKRTQIDQKSSSHRSEIISLEKEQSFKRISTGYQEFDRVLGGGIVPGSLILVGGDPGIGKSTLLLKSATNMALSNRILYITAEESAHQVRIRWKRINHGESKLHLLSETDLEEIIEELYQFNPEVVIIDSIQALNNENLTSAPGSVAQVRECSACLQKVAKKRNIALLIVGHVTKEGALAGPKVLEHLVDAVLTFEGDRLGSHRLLRAIKNRYGATNELGVFEMQGDGLLEVQNPSELFLSNESASGIATIVACEGSRSIAVDLQALINPSTYATPKRTATGVETNRLHQILAVLEKHIGLTLSRHDCYLAVAGGLAVDEPAADLGIAMAIVSSFKNIEIPKKTILIGEIGLGGQLRPVKQISQRIQEAIRLGFEIAVVPEGISSNELKSIKTKDIQLIKVSTIQDSLFEVLGLKSN